MIRRIGIASLIWGGSILLSRVIGIVREAVIGRTIGGGATADVFWASFIVPDFLNYLLAGGALSIVFIPIFSGYLARDEEDKGWEAFSVIATLLTAVLVVLIAILSLLLPRLTPLVVPGFSAVQQAEVVRLTRIILPAQLFHIVGGLLAAVLLAQDRHVLPAAAPLVYTGGVVVGGLLGGSAAGADGFAWGVLVGSVLGPFGLPLVGCLRGRFAWRLRWEPRHPDLKTYLLLSLPVMLGWSIAVVDDWFLRREGSYLGIGVVSVLTYAKTLMKVPRGVFGLAAGQAAYPTLARMVGEGRVGDMYRTLIETAKATLVLAFAAQAVLTVCGYEVAWVIYGKERIPEAQLKDIGYCLALVCVALPAWTAVPLVVRGFYSLEKTWVPALLGTVVAIVSYPFYVLARTHFGMYGLAAMSSVAMTIYGIVMVVLLARLVRARSPAAQPQLSPFLVRSVVGVVAGVGVGWGISLLIPGAETLRSALLRGLAIGSAAALVFFVVCYLIGVEEVRDLVWQVKKRLLRKEPS